MFFACSLSSVSISGLLTFRSEIYFSDEAGYLRVFESTVLRYMERSRSSVEGRTPQACDRWCVSLIILFPAFKPQTLTKASRRSKTKCSGIRPQCHNCRKRKSVCSWPRTLVAGNYQPIVFLDTEPEVEPQKRTQPVLDTVASSKSAFALPASSQIERLSQIFLNRHHDVELCSFLHKPSLDIAVLYTRSPLLVTAIFSLSALYISENEAKGDFGFESTTALSNHYAQYARTYARLLSDEPSGV
jgi:hypothetical protein